MSLRPWAVLLGLVSVGAAVWLGRERLLSERAEFDAWRRTAEAGREEAERSGADAAAAGLEREAELRARLDAGEELLAAVTRERDQARDALRAASDEAESLRAQLGRLESGQGQLQQELAESDDERLRHLGESARLLEQVIDREQQLELVNRTLADLREERAAAERPAAVATIVRGDSCASRVSEALRLSGAGHALVLEARLGEDGGLSGILVRLNDEGQPARLVSAERGALTFTQGQASLRLDGIGDTAGLASDPFELDLPAFDAAGWVTAGLSVPADFRPASETALALTALLERYGWRLAALESVDGATLYRVELQQLDASGELLRTLRAPRAALVAGPELQLWDGTVAAGADERGFFEGIFRLPLPGLDAAAWDEALGLGRR